MIAPTTPAPASLDTLPTILIGIDRDTAQGQRCPACRSEVWPDIGQPVALSAVGMFVRCHDKTCAPVFAGQLTAAARPGQGSYVKYSGLEVCTDCAMILANGELGDGTDRDAEVAQAQVDNWGQDTRHMVLTCSGEDCEPSFSWSPCDGCGSTLGGDRHSAAVLAPKPSTVALASTGALVPVAMPDAPGWWQDADIEDSATVLYRAATVNDNSAPLTGLSVQLQERHEITAGNEIATVGPSISIRDHVLPDAWLLLPVATAVRVARRILALADMLPDTDTAPSPRPAHSDYPHESGRLIDCAACELGPCQCDPATDAPCVSAHCVQDQDG